MKTKTVDVSKAKSIYGGISEPELVWLAERAGEHRVIVEIGSYLGRSTRAMLDHMKEDGIVYAMDDWKGPRDVYLTKKERDNLIFRFMENVEATKHMNWNIEEGKLHMIVGDYGLTYQDWDERKIRPDLVFIDGSHEYKDVKRDILFWKDRVVSGGLLCGHDYGYFEDVTVAVTELLGKVEVAEGTTIWFKEMR